MYRIVFLCILQLSKLLIHQYPNNLVFRLFSFDYFLFAKKTNSFRDKYRRTHVHHVKSSEKCSGGGGEEGVALLEETSANFLE